MTQKELNRFFSKIRVTESCWNWTSAITAKRNSTKGYGSFTLDGKPKYAHRLSYEHHIGKIPEGFEVHHICENTLCVNPSHLEVVSHSENVYRANGKGDIKIKCKLGHIMNISSLCLTYENENCESCNEIRKRQWYFKKTGYPHTLLARF